jgi:outer membrane immunogenic protein
MKNAVVGIAAIVVLIGTPALAADMPVKAPPPVAPIAPVANWTGFYVGAQIGGASFDPSCSGTNSRPNDFEEEALPCTPAFPGDALSNSSLSSASVIGGGKIGYDYQWDRVVLGVVGEFDWTHLNSTSVEQYTMFNGGVGNASEQIDWLASARARAGWAFDNVLFYATGGVAWTRIKASASWVPEWAGQVSSDRTGVVAGGGFEYRFTPNLSFVGELLWYDFGTTSVNTSLGDPPTTFTTTFKSQDIVSGTLGVNWRF